MPLTVLERASFKGCFVAGCVFLLITLAALVGIGVGIGYLIYG